ncbi:hypothetical protein KXD40_005169 [Peronospora effusa]|nr:hypothetical protein KXD40_005169 [Peronospora effusa]
MGYLLQGDAIEDEEQHYVAKKDDFVSSKLLRGLFGDIIMQYFEDIPENLISKEAFVCILALFYEFVVVLEDILFWCQDMTKE